MTWIQTHLRILHERPTVTTFAEALALVRSEAAAAERSRLAHAEKTGRALDQNITATESWDKHVAAAKAQTRTLGGHEGRGFAEIEAGIELAVDDGVRDARRG